MVSSPDSPRGGLHVASPVILYGVPIHQAIASGNLTKMKRLAKQAEAHLQKHGDLRAALELLRVEIAKAEKKAIRK
jgi:hypothetical protein